MDISFNSSNVQSFSTPTTNASEAGHIRESYISSHEEVIVHDFLEGLQPGSSAFIDDSSKKSEILLTSF